MRISLPDDQRAGKGAAGPLGVGCRGGVPDEGLGLTGLGGRENINQVGRQLAWGVPRQQDRDLLRPPS
jgi:hypothetical protein